MARSILTNTDFNKNELQNARVQNLASAPSSPVVGQIYYDTTLEVFRVYTGVTKGWIASDGSDIPNGTITSAKIADGTITNIDINASAGIALTKLATDPLARANHTGTQDVTTINFAATDKLLGRDTAGTGAGEEIGVTGGIVFNGSGSIQTAAFTGDVTKALGGTVLTIANNAVVTAYINNDAVTYAKIQNVSATDRLLGRDTAAAGDIEEITVGGGIEFTGSLGIQVSAFTGDVTKAAGGTSTTIANSVVTNAKLANMPTMTIKGNNTGGSAAPIDLTAAQAKTVLGITAADVSGFDTQVRTNRLDQMATPTASVGMGSQKIINLAEPTNPQDAATKNYVDLARQGIRLKDSVVAASTGPLTLSGTQTVDGIALVGGDRVLVKDQAAPAANGIYVVAAGAWSRATDADTAAEVSDGATVWVNSGTANGNTTWSQINTITTIGTDAQSWVQQGAAVSYTAGAGLTLTGSTLDVGQGTGITVSADSIAVDTAVVARKYNTTVGDGAATSYVITHNLGNQWCTVQVFRNSGSFDQIECDIELTSTNTATLRFAVAPTSAQYRVVITG